MGFKDKPPFPDDLYRDLPRSPITYVSREEWGALPPKAEHKIPPDSFPVDNFVMGYTETDPCETKEACMQTMRELQKKHMDMGYSDIRYNFVIGRDKTVYVGRGWDRWPGVHSRFCKLDGKNYEVVHFGQKGALPHVDWSMHAWDLSDQGIWAGKLLENASILQDYMDPLPASRPEIPEGMESWVFDKEAFYKQNEDPNYCYPHEFQALKDLK